MKKKTSPIRLDRRMFIKRFEGFDEFYEIDTKPIGKGAFGEVFRCVHSITREIRAIKVVRKFKMASVKNFLHEIELLKKLDHPNIIRLYEYYEDASCVYLIMEYCEGGELFERITAIGSFTEYDAALLFRQMLNSLNYCNQKGICHKDLKPENFLFNSKDPNSSLKLIDFGLSQVFSSPGVSKAKMSVSVGTPYYKAPEVIKGSYDEKCDVWSLGVILYILLCGSPPFYGSTDLMIQERVLGGKFAFDLPIWDSISKDCKDLITKMLRPPERRLTCAQVIEHRWVKVSAEEVRIRELPDLITKQLSVFRRLQKMKQAVLTYMACQLSEKEMRNLKRLFLGLDKNGDGLLSIEEIMDGLKNSSNKQELTDIVHSLDTNESGFIDYNEFLAASLQEDIYLKKEKIIQAFCMFDTDRSGTIGIAELKSIVYPELGEVDEEELKQLISVGDINKDGKIDLEDFFKMMYEVKGETDIESKAAPPK